MTKTHVFRKKTSKRKTKRNNAPNFLGGDQTLNKSEYDSEILYVIGSMIRVLHTHIFSIKILNHSQVWQRQKPCCHDENVWTFKVARLWPKGAGIAKQVLFPQSAPNLNSLCAPFSPCFLVSWAQSCRTRKVDSNKFLCCDCIESVSRLQLFHAYEVVNRSCNMSVQFSIVFYITQIFTVCSCCSHGEMERGFAFRALLWEKKTMHTHIFHDIWSKCLLNLCKM